MATDATTSTLQPRPEVFYPERDGKPMAETRVHRNAMFDLIVGFEDWLANDPLAYISGNDFVYFVAGDPKRVVSPDVWVVRGIDKHRNRPSYKTWLEGGKGPDLVVEISSKSTRREDLRKKFLLYRDDLQVREYFLFDPLGEYLKPRLQGFRLDGEDYFTIDPEAGRLPSEVLGLHLIATGQTVRLFDPALGRIMPTRAEALAAAERSGHRQSRIIRTQEAALQAQEAALRDSAATLQAQEAALRDSAAAVRERDQALADAHRERAELLAELARLRPGGLPE